MKFSAMPYERPDMEEVKKRVEQLTQALKNAPDAGEAVRAFRELDELKDHIYTLSTLAMIRHNVNTKDEFYDAEQTFFDESMPELQEQFHHFQLALLDSPHRPALEEEFGGLMFRNLEISVKTMIPEIVPDLQQENKLSSEYDKLVASAQIEFNGAIMNLAQIGAYYVDPDRDVRRRALEAAAGWGVENAQRLDELYDELVQLRTRFARKMGYENFVELGYYRMTRNCYDREMVAKFRKGVRDHIVPIAARLKAAQAERIGVGELTPVDDAFEYPTGNAKPFGTPDEIMAHGQKMYHELSPETAEFIDFMLENELFDVLARPGKSAGGYCADIPDYKAPFIFASFNGTSGDVDVLTHEAGHAYACYVSRDLKPSDWRSYTSETAEVHSMSMEFFTWPWMEGFFGQLTGKYRYSHLASALTFLPYGTMVDEFQHHVYEKPEMTPGERNELWLELEKVYRPWLKLEGTPFYGEGRRWQRQMHIYMMPFYYIDYCLAQTVSLAFWAENQADHDAAWKRYNEFVGHAGRKSFVELIEATGLPSPFGEDALKTVADAAAAWLDGQPKYE